MSDSPALERNFEIVNTLGLHARAAAAFVQTAQKYKAEVMIHKDDLSVNGKSIMGILMLAAAKGTTISVSAEGPDANEAMDAIGELVRNGFWEKEPR